MIKEVPYPTWTCQGCVYVGKFECLQQACYADPKHSDKCIKVTE